MDLLVHLSRKSGKTLVASLHAIDFALSHFERVIGLREGRIMFDAPAGEVSPAMTRRLYKITAH